MATNRIPSSAGRAPLQAFLLGMAALFMLTVGAILQSSLAANYAPPSLVAWQRAHEGHLTIKWAGAARVQQIRKDNQLILRFASPLASDMTSALRNLSNFVDLGRTIVDGRDLSMMLRPGTASRVDVRERGIVTVDFFRDPDTVPRARVTASAIDRGIRLTLDWPGSTRIDEGRDINQLSLEVKPAWGLDPGQLTELQRGLQPWLNGLSAASGPESTTLSIVLDPQVAPSVRSWGTTRTTIDLIRDASTLPAPAAGPKGPVFIPEKRPLAVTSADSDAGPPIPRRRPLRSSAAEAVTKVDQEATTANDAGGAPPEALVFDWNGPVAAAVFIRAGHLWVVFDQQDSGRLSNMPTSPTAFGAGSMVAATGGTALRFPLQEPVNIGVHQMADGSWRIEPLATASPPRPVTIERVDGSAALSVNVASGARIVNVVDPAVGDRIDILPVRDPGLGQPNGRRLVDLEFLPTAQGLAWRPLNDGLAAHLDESGLRFSSPGGLSLSTIIADRSKPTDPVIREAMAENEAESEKPSESLVEHPAGKPLRGDPSQVRDTGKPSSYFDLAGSAVERPLAGEFRRIRRQAIGKAAPEERDRARLDLARLLVSERLAIEARTVLSAISDEAENDVVLQKRALNGVSAFLIGHLAEASSLLLDPDLSGDEEIDIWRAALESVEDEWQTAADRWRNASDLLDIYPPRLKLDLGLMALNAAIETNDEMMMLQGLLRLTSLSLNPYDKARVDAMRALKAERAGDLEKARALFTDLTDSPHPAIRTLANFQLSSMNLVANPHQPDVLAAIARRMPLWRGHPEEKAMLNRLALRYKDANALRRALTTWRRLIKLYPEAADDHDLKREREDTFVQALTNATEPTLDLLEVYAIYLDFINLLPGDPEAKSVHRNLARHLAELDLLDQAINVLQPLMTSSSDAIERVEVALEIATLMLRQDRAAPALSLVNGTGGAGSTLPPQLVEQRHLLRSQALARLDRADDALRELRELQSPKARQLRAKILWGERRWQRLAAVIESYFANADPLSSLTEDEQELVLWLALARQQEGPFDQLSALRTRFGAAMQGGPHGYAFDVATQGAVNTSEIEDLLAATENQLAELQRFRKATPAFP